MSERPRWIANKRPSSMATISAQPMLRPFLSQLGRSFHASHSLFRIIPMPHDDEASTQKSIEEVTGGFDRKEPQNSEES